MGETSGRVVYYNGRYVPETEACVSIYDSALMFGDVIFEMTRSFNKKQFKLREHIDRLFKSAKYLRIPIMLTAEELEKVCYETIERNEPVFTASDEHRLLINATRGPLGIYSQIFGGKNEPTLIVADFPLKWTVASMAPLFETGINAVIPSQRAVPSKLVEQKVKNRNRINWVMANIEVAQHKGDNNWALLLDEEGYVTEGSGSNFFIVDKGRLLTPEGRNILRGISREYVFELAKDLGIECVEKNIEPYDVINADEAFMTGTPFCILPVTSLGGEKTGAGAPGKLTMKLLQTWGRNVGVNIVEQMRAFAKEYEHQASNAGATPYKFSAPSKK